jgi:hypothetical protein
MIDPHFLEFWGKYLTEVARGQKQLEDLPRWMQQGFQGWEDLRELFARSYGLDRLQPNSSAYNDAWKQATAEFRKSFRETFAALGWVAEEQYEELQQENQRLKDRVAAHEETIGRLRSLLDAEGLDQQKTVEVFQALIQKQSREFEKLMKNLSAPTPPDKSPSSE